MQAHVAIAIRIAHSLHSTATKRSNIQERLNYKEAHKEAQTLLEEAAAVLGHSQVLLEGRHSQGKDRTSHTETEVRLLQRLEEELVAAR